jgi:hypothetical protein
MSNDHVESLVTREEAPTPPVEEVLDAQRETTTTGIVAQEGPLDLVGDDHPAPNAEPASAALINNTGDDGGASSG